MQGARQVLSKCVPTGSEQVVNLKTNFLSCKM